MKQTGGPIQLIVMDMDGTLLDTDHVSVPRRNIAALRAARALGVKLAIASGRTWSLIADTARQLGGVDYAILSNGAAIWEEASGTITVHRAIPNPQAVELIALFQREAIPFEVYWEGQNYVRAADRELVCHNNPGSYRSFFEAHTCYPEDLVEALAGRDVEKFNLFSVPAHRRQWLEEQAKTAGPLEVANAFASNMEFAAAGVSKGAALRALAERLGLGAEAVMAFGDAGNDLEMLSWAFWSFAMDNGSPQAKAAARCCTASNGEAGVGQAVEHFVLGL